MGDEGDEGDEDKGDGDHSSPFDQRESLLRGVFPFDQRGF